MATVNVVLFSYKKYKNGSSPIMLRITKNSQLKYFKIGDETFNTFEKHWDEEFCLMKRDKRLNPDYEKQNAYISKKKAEATQILSDFEENRIPWTLYMFGEKYKNPFRTENVSLFVERRIEYLKSNERYNSAKGLQGTFDLLKKFHTSFDKLQFPDINLDLIERFEKFLQVNQNYKSTSVGILMRDIRGILNEAISQGVGCKESYPFSKIYGAQKVFKISKLIVKTRKRFIPKEFLIKMFNAEFDEPHLNWAKNLFLFSFFSSGINFKDMASLTRMNIKTILSEDNTNRYFIELFRSKTGAKIEFPITTNVKTILDWFDVNYPEKKNYLIPIITNHKLEGEKLNEHIICRRKRFNMHLKTIAERLDFPESINDITSYFARHSYATSMLRNGISIEKISQALGHADIKTTQIYLGGFDRNDIAEANQALLD